MRPACRAVAEEGRQGRSEVTTTRPTATRWRGVRASESCIGRFPQLRRQSPINRGEGGAAAGGILALELSPRDDGIARDRKQDGELHTRRWRATLHHPRH